MTHIHQLKKPYIMAHTTSSGDSFWRTQGGGSFSWNTSMAINSNAAPPGVGIKEVVVKKEVEMVLPPDDCPDFKKRRKRKRNRKRRTKTIEIPIAHYLEVYGTVYIYGPAASNDIADLLESQVNGIWNNPYPSKPHTGRYIYKQVMEVQFNIDFVYVSINKAKRKAKGNTDQTVNFMRVVDEEGAASFFGGNSGQLNLEMNRDRGGTTVAHEIGHMMGYRDEDPDDCTHTTDMLLDKFYNGVLPLMYSGGGHSDQLDERVRTERDVMGLDVWGNWVHNGGFMGEPLNNIIYEQNANGPDGHLECERHWKRK